MSRDLLLFLEDMETACAKIVEYSSGQTQAQTFADAMRFDAILMNFHILGEAVKHLPMDFTSRYPEVPWRLVAGMRYFVAHVYFALDLDLLWDTMQNDVPDLSLMLKEIIAREHASR